MKIDFGTQSLERLSKWINGRNALLVTSPGFEKRGIVQSILKNNPEIVQVIATIEPNPTVVQLEKLYKTLDFHSFDVIVALGGGSVIDISKALSIYRKIDDENSFNVIEEILFYNRRPENIEYKPIIAIPTTAGTGSEVTPWGTIWDAINKKKYSIHTEKLWCEVAICDPKLTLTLPKELTIQTGLDALSHSLEAIWNVNANPISTRYAIQAIPQIIEVLPKLLLELDNIELRAEMMLASLNAGLAFSNTQTAVAHAMSYYMTLHKGISHGIAASITLPDITKVAMSNETIKLILRKGLGENPVEKLQDLLEDLDVSTNYLDYDLTTNDFYLIKDSLAQTPRSKNSLIDMDELFTRIESRY